MLNKKNLSVIFAVVLLCTCIVGVLTVGAQVSGNKQYYMTVGGALSSAPEGMTAVSGTSNYASINQAVKAAKNLTWQEGDTLTIFMRGQVGTADATGKFLFFGGIYENTTIFRSDDTMLPITIDGDDPLTAEVEKTNGFGLSGSGINQSIQATNNYTFKNLTLTNWKNTSAKFRAGIGNVVFDNVDFGAATGNLVLTADSTSTLDDSGNELLFNGWDAAKWAANADENGIITTSLTLKNTTYGSATGKVGVKENVSGWAITSGDLAGKSYSNIRSKVVIGTGATVDNAHIFVNSLGASVTNGYNQGGNTQAYEYVFEVAGGSVGTLYGQRNQTPANGNIVVNVSAGCVNDGYIGMNNVSSQTIFDSTQAFVGNVTHNLTGGTVGTNYYGFREGKLDGTLTVNVGKDVVLNNNKIISEDYADLENVVVSYSGRTFASWNALPFMNSGVTIKNLHTKLHDCDLGSSVYLNVVGSGAVTNIENTLSGTITTSDNWAFLGGQSGVISGTITNNIACVWNYTGTNNDKALCAGSWGAEVTGKITNYILPGADVSVFVAGNRSGNSKNIETIVTGGKIGVLYCGGSGSNETSGMNIKTTVTGGQISEYYGASAADTATVAKVQNIIGEKKADGTYSGDACINRFYGGSYISTSIGLIENTFYAGTIGYPTRDDDGLWYNKYYCYGGSYQGTVAAIRNTFYGGYFNATYYYCGNNSSDKTNYSTFSADTTLYDRGTEAQVINYVYGGHFARFAAGSNGGHIDTIENYINCPTEGAASAREGAFYCGHGADENTSIYSEIQGFAPAYVTGNGEITEDTDLSGQIYSGNNSGVIGSIENVIKNDAVIGTFYGGCNGGVATTIKTTVKKDADSEAAPEIGSFIGISREATSSTPVSIVNTVEAGKIENFYAGHNKGSAATVITSITNNLKGGTIERFYGGNNIYSNVVEQEDGTNKTVYIVGTVGSITNNVPSGSTVHVEWLYSGGIIGNVGTVTNNFQSANATFGVVYGGAYGTGSFKEPYQGGTIDSITNTVSAGTFESFYGGGRRGHNVKIRTNITGGTFNEIYGAGNQATLENTADDLAVQTTIENATVTGNIYGGSYYGDIKGNIKIIFYDGTYNGNTFTGNRFGNITGNVIGTVNGGTFNRYFGGSDGLETYGSNSYGSYTVITGDVTNHINGGTFTGATVVNNDSTTSNIAMVLGGYYGNIVGSVTNNFTNQSGAGAAISTGKIVFGGGYMNVITASGSNGYAIKNTISAGTFKGFWGGSYRNVAGTNYKVVGNIINTINGGTFNGTPSFVGSCANAGHTGNVTNTFNGGTFTGYVAGGMYMTASGFKNYAYWVGQVTSTVSSSFTSNGGSFGAMFYVCGPYGAYKDASANVVKAILTKNGNSVSTRTYNSDYTTTGTVK